MRPSSDRVIIVGAGPVGLCLALALAQQGVPVTLIDALGEDHFLAQAPRAGTNHPPTLELFPRIGLYQELDIEFEGFTYSDLVLNIEVAYDFRRNGYAERNCISDPKEWSNLFHWKGPPDRWRVHFPVEPGDDEAVISRPEALQARLQAF